MWFEQLNRERERNNSRTYLRWWRGRVFLQDSRMSHRFFTPIFALLLHNKVHCTPGREREREEGESWVRGKFNFENNFANTKLTLYTQTYTFTHMSDGFHIRFECVRNTKIIVLKTQNLHVMFVFYRFRSFFFSANLVWWFSFPFYNRAPFFLSFYGMMNLHCYLSRCERVTN